MEINTRIKEARKRKGMTQEELANALHITRDSVVKWESVKYNAVPKLENLIEIAELLDVDLDYLTGRIDDYTHTAEIIRSSTGLSKEAVETLMRWHNGKAGEKMYIMILSALLEKKKYFGNALARIWNYVTYTDKPVGIRQKEHDTVIDTGKPPYIDVLSYSISLAFNDLSSLIRKEFQKK